MAKNIKYITTGQFAKQVNLSRIRIWVLVKQKRIKATKFEGIYRIPIEEVEKFKTLQAVRKRQQQQDEEALPEDVEDISEHMGQEKPKTIKLRSSRFFRAKDFYKDREDEDHQARDVDYKAWRRGGW